MYPVIVVPRKRRNVITFDRIDLSTTIWKSNSKMQKKKKHSCSEFLCNGDSNENEVVETISSGQCTYYSFLSHFHCNLNEENKQPSLSVYTDISIVHILHTCTSYKFLYFDIMANKKYKHFENCPISPFTFLTNKNFFTFTFYFDRRI